MRKKDITVEELKQLLIAHSNYDQSWQMETQKRLRQALGKGKEEIKEEDQKIIALKENLEVRIAEIMARRLKRNRRNITFLSSRDLNNIISFMLDGFEEIEGEKLDREERKIISKSAKLILENIFEMVYSMISEDENPYYEYWRWIKTVVDLANERGILSTEIFSNKETVDEVTRRMFTQDEFRILKKRYIDKFMDPEVIKKKIFLPMLEAISEGHEEERKEMERDLEAEFMPQIREIKKAKRILDIIIKEEAARIYSAA